MRETSISMITLGPGNYGLILIGCAVALGALFVAIKGAKDRLRLSFCAFALGGAAWIAGIGLIGLTGKFAFDMMVNYGGLVFVTGFLLIALSIDAPMEFGISPYLLFLPAAIEAVFIIPAKLINIGMTVGPHGTLVPLTGPFILPHAMLTALYTLLGIVILGYKFTRSVGKERARIKYLFLGTGLFMATSVLCDAVLPAFHVANLNLYGPLSSVLFIGLTAYAILRHELLDIRVAIQRGLIYTVLIALIAACYALVFEIIGIFIDRISNAAAILTGAAVTVAAAFTLPIVEGFFRRVTDRFFFKDRYKYADALRELSQIVFTAVELDALVSGIETALRDVLKAESVQLQISSAEKVSLAARTHVGARGQTLEVPIALDGDQIGWIFCGPKKSGDAYTAEDVSLLETFAYQAATALSRAKYYAEIKTHAQTLESKVEKRTEDLRLAQDRQKQMLIDISHNLQTPLAVFQTKIEQLKRSDRGSGKDVTGFEQSLKDLSVFIYSLLSLAKLENRAEPAATVEVDLSALMLEIAEEIGVIAESSDIELSVDIEKGLVVAGSEKELREVALNILGNAVKYMKPVGKRRMRIVLEKRGSSALLSVSDNGIGIAPADAERVFERFYRVQSSGPTGTGLGLAIAKQIVVSHGGKVWLESEEGRGTTFFVEVPVVDAGRSYRVG